MPGDTFGWAYYRQRHKELVQAPERAQLIRRIEANRRAEQAGQHQAGLHKRALAVAGVQLVRLGNRLQQAAALSAQ